MMSACFFSIFALFLRCLRFFSDTSDFFSHSFVLWKVEFPENGLGEVDGSGNVIYGVELEGWGGRRVLERTHPMVGRSVVGEACYVINAATGQ